MQIQSKKFSSGPYRFPQIAVKKSAQRLPPWSRDCPCVLSVAASTVRLGQGRLSGVLASGAVRVSGRQYIIRDNTVSRKYLRGVVFSQKTDGFETHHGLHARVY